MKILKNLIAGWLVIPSLFILPQCAKVVSPTGGDKDTLAPVMTKSNPDYRSINFNDDKVEIWFDEYIQLKEILQKLTVSPPMLKKPEITAKGKSVVLEFQEKLMPNSTYTISFADAIQDNNENNSLKDFEFVFSTGSSIDSLILYGRVIDAYTLKPVEGVLVMLYENFNDSIPYKELPNHMARTNKQGRFRLSNLKSANYKLFALKDGNSNFKLDQTNEEIAFVDKIIPKEKLISPSKMKDTLVNSVKLYLFKENSRIQTITGFSRDQRNKLSFSFSKRPSGDVKLNPIGFKGLKNWYLKESNLIGDSINYWITNKEVLAKDTLIIITAYQRTDSLLILRPVTDTLKFLYIEPEKTRSKRKDGDKEEKPERLIVNCNIKEGKVVKPIFPTFFSFSQPIKSIDQSKIKLYNFSDSTQIENLPFIKDSINPRKYSFEYSYRNGNSYRIIALPGAFSSINDLINDSLVVNFKGANPEEFGTLSILLQNRKTPVFVELLTESGKVVNRVIVKNDSKPVFQFVDPGKYKVRFVEDVNGNGKWDTGNYSKKLQPEKIYFLEEPKTKGIINVRANWENEIIFDFQTKR